MLLSEARPRPWRERNPLKRGFNQEETDKAAFDELKKDAQFTMDYKKNGRYGKYTHSNSTSAYDSAAVEKFQNAIPKLIEILKYRLPKSDVGKYVTDITSGDSRICVSLVDTHHSHKIDPKLKDSLPYKHVRHYFTTADYNEETGTFDITGIDNRVWIDNDFFRSVLKRNGISAKDFALMNDDLVEEFIMDYVYPTVKKKIKERIEYNTNLDATLEVNDLLRRAGRRKVGKPLEDWDAFRLQYDSGYYD